MKLAVYGTGGMGRETLEAAQESGQWDELFFVADKAYLPAGEARRLDGYPVCALEEMADAYAPEETEVLVCTGEPADRARMAARVRAHGFRLGRFVDPSVKLHVSTRLGEGVILLRGVILASGVWIEDNAALSFGVILGHDCHIAPHCYLAPGAVLGGTTAMGQEAFCGMGAILREGKQIGARAIVGQGAVVTKDVPPDVTVVGNPAHPLGDAGARKVFHR